jgi:hypothetical protein
MPPGGAPLRTREKLLSALDFAPSWLPPFALRYDAGAHEPAKPFATTIPEQDRRPGRKMAAELAEVHYGAVK